MSYLAEQIKDAVTMPDVLGRYGLLDGNRRGRIPCPLHNGTDKNFAYKDKSFRCYVCNESGTVIDFAMKLFDLPFQAACKRLNDDFNLGLSDEPPSKETRSKLLQMRREREEAELAELARFKRLAREFRFWRWCKDNLQPALIGDDVVIHPLYAEAVKRVERLEYQLDEMMERR